MNDKLSRYAQLVAQAKSQIKELSVEDTKAELAAESAVQLIDVREESEWQRGHLPDAIHLSRGLLEVKIEKAMPDVNAPIILYCGGGGRSALAALSLQVMGYTNVQSMADGFKAWIASGEDARIVEPTS